jgi:hypothetical protein
MSRKALSPPKRQEQQMAKKSMMGEAADSVRSIAGAALGAAAVAATGVIVTRVAGAIRSRGKDLEQATPKLQKLAGDAVSKPLAPKAKRAAAKRKTKPAGKKVAAKKAAKKRRAKR